MTAKREYYTTNGLEAITVIQTWDLDFELGNAVKYIARLGKKPTASKIEDLDKAIQYLQFEQDKILKQQQPKKK